MSKELDYDNLSEADKDWLRARGQGNRIPGEQKSDPVGIVLDATESAESILSKTPNTGTATGSTEGVEVHEDDEEGYTEEDYKAWTVAELKAEIDDRNEAINASNAAAKEADENAEQADLIDSGDGKKATLIAALLAADSETPNGEPEEQA